LTELLVGTKKGLFRLEGNGGGFEITARAFAGQSVEYAMRDPRTGRYLASVTSWFYGPRIWVTDDPTGEWEQAEGTTLPEGEEQALERLWVIVPGEADGVLYAGGDPGPLFESRDGGLTWSLNRGLWDHPTRPDWSPGNGGLCLHTIAPWHGDPSRLLVAISSVGVWLSDDGGETWRHSNTGIEPDYLPEEARGNPIQHCVHDVRRSPAKPERLFMQFHGGVYRSDDAGENWIDVGDGLPSDFGFPIVVDPSDPDSAYVIPLIGAEDRTPPEGAVRVWETRDAGATWTPRGDGLPAQSYLTILREAFDNAGEGERMELYFGATSGEVFGSADAGASWRQVADHLPPVYSVRTALGDWHRRCLSPASRTGVRHPRGCQTPCQALAERGRDAGDLPVGDLALDLLGRRDVVGVRLRAERAEADAVLVEAEHGVAAAGERAVLQRLDRQEDRAVDALEGARQHVRAEERLVAVDTDRPDSLVLRP